MTTPVVSELHEEILPHVRQRLEAFGWCGVLMCNCGDRNNPAEYHDSKGPIGGLQGFDYCVKYIHQKLVVYRRKSELEKAQKHRAGLKRPHAIAKWDQAVAEAERGLRSAQDLLDLLLTLPTRMYIWEREALAEVSS